MSNSSQAVNIYNANAISQQSKIRKNLILKKKKKKLLILKLPRIFRTGKEGLLTRFHLNRSLEGLCDREAAGSELEAALK